MKHPTPEQIATIRNTLFVLEGSGVTGHEADKARMRAFLERWAPSKLAKEASPQANTGETKKP